MAHSKEEIFVPGIGDPVSHYCHVTKVGNLVFLAGVSATDSEGRVVGGTDVVEQARVTHENMKKSLAAAGATFKDVVKVTVYVMDMTDRAAINTVRQQYFGDHYPVSTLVQVSRLYKDGLKLEIDAIAVLTGE